ncbi:hypothetical protein QEW_2427 [Clostridioides difficile CD160]|nr:hypothetical protein QEW_2427 [Clostridioides difficile CD160]MCI9993581.1 hypothetical protein [Clostridioides difficile]HBF5457501.1 hypothetical protein [Clostridioides difficile]
MYLKDIKEWLKETISDKNTAFYIGKIDANKEKVIGIYNKDSNSNKIAIGGLINTSTSTKAITILIHWSKNCDTTEKMSRCIYDLFNGKTVVINKVNAFFIMKNDEPVFLGTDENGIYEYVIDLDIIYER